MWLATLALRGNRPRVVSASAMSPPVFAYTALDAPESAHGAPMVETRECPLCRWAVDPNQRLVDRSGSALFLQNARMQGALTGSGVIVPTRHAPTVFDLTENELRDTFGLLAAVKDWMDRTYQPDGYNIGWNCGAAAGQEIMHAHLHVIPRFADEPFAGRGIRSWLKQDANRRPRPGGHT